MVHVPIPTGTKFNKWQALHRTKENVPRHDKVYYLCLCECGTVQPVEVNLLRKGLSKGCVKCMWGKVIKDVLYDTLTQPQKRLYRNYRRNALDRNLDYNLTCAEFLGLTSSPCHYCGALPAQSVVEERTKTDNLVYAFNGIDRMDNTIGYVFSNCVACCKMCNLAKRDVPYDEWMTYLERITRFQNQRSTSSPASSAD